MRISHEHQFVFLAVPRTGSTTIRNILDGYSDIKSVHITETTNDFPFYNHISALELKKIFDGRDWHWFDYKRFCVIRNPYDRVVSLYHHYLQERAKARRKRDIVLSMIDTVKDNLKPSRIPTFKDYVMRIEPETRLPTSLKNFICDEKSNFLVEDVLMYERLKEELPRYFYDLEIDFSAEDIPHLNASKDRSEYRSYYDEETIEKVSTIYAYEIARFGYSF